VIRYVDSCGWTWAVCELADRPPAEAPEGAAAIPSDRPALAGPVADRPLALAATRGDAPPADDAEEPGELYFFSRLGTRKLRGYPAAWAALPRAGLEALCERAREVGATGAGALA
jgi:hypothetical protein